MAHLEFAGSGGATPAVDPRLTIESEEEGRRGWSTALVVVGLLVLWETVVRLDLLSRFYFLPPTSIVRGVVELARAGLLQEVGRHWPGQRLEVISGYRHPKVAKNPRSPHMKGLACDFRVASETCLYALPEQKLGQIPGSGGSARLQMMVGVTRTKDIVIRSRRISGCRISTPGCSTVRSGGRCSSTAAIRTMRAMRLPRRPFPTAC